MNEHGGYKAISNNTWTTDFLKNSLIDEKINKLFTGERSNIKHKSFKEQVARMVRTSSLINNSGKSSKVKNIKSLRS